METLWRTTDKLVLAVSGGIDSMVLLHQFCQIPKAKRPEFIVMSINHGMRATSQRDIDLVKEYCEQQNIPFFTNYNIPNHLKSENDARQFRYAELFRVAKEQHCQMIVTAHHLDDQAETILLKLLRGSSLKGITGISAMREIDTIKVVRPLLHWRKKDIEEYALLHNIHYLEDETNNQLNYSRNRIRQQVMPLLQQENARFTQHFSDFSHDLQDVLTVAEKHIQFLLADVLIDNKLSRHALNLLSSAEKRLIIAHYLAQYHVLERSFVDKIYNLIQSDNGFKQVQLATDIICEISYDFIAVVKIIDKQPSNTEYMIKNLQEDNELYLSVEPTMESVCHVGKEQLPLYVRPRRAGDKMRLNGYHKKVSRLFIDAKVPLNERDAIQVVQDVSGTVIFINDNRFIHLSKPKETDKIKEYYLNKRK